MTWTEVDKNMLTFLLSALDMVSKAIRYLGGTMRKEPFSPTCFVSI